MKKTKICLLPNIENKGRLFRGAGAFATGSAALWLWPKSPLFGASLGAASAFLAFEAVRGWCALRACGVRTKF